MRHRAGDRAMGVGEIEFERGKSEGGIERRLAMRLIDEAPEMRRAAEVARQQRAQKGVRRREGEAVSRVIEAGGARALRRVEEIEPATLIGRGGVGEVEPMDLHDIGAVFVFRQVFDCQAAPSFASVPAKLAPPAGCP